MKNNSSINKWYRLEQKNLDNQFTNRLMTGLNCSPFEAKCIVNAMYETYQPFFNNVNTLIPGQAIFQAISVNTPPSAPLSKAAYVSVILTIDAGKEDLEVRYKDGVIGLRQHRLIRICNEAYEQGGLLTVEDFANRILNCGERTIVRDIKALKDKGIILPLRSIVKDMGKSISHRSLIIKLWLTGNEYSDISRKTNHSIPSVKNYIDKFKRVILLTGQNHDNVSIAFLTKLSEPLVKELIKIYKKSDMVPHRKEELNLLLKTKKK